MDDKARSHNINPKTKSAKANTQQWRDDLRNKCMKRAKTARKDLLLRKRRGCSVNNNGCSISFPRGNDVYMKSHHDCEVKREVIDSYNEQGDYEWHDDMKSDHPMERDNAVKLVAKSLVEREIQRSMIDLDHCRLQHASASTDTVMGPKLISWSEDSQETESQEHSELFRRNEGEYTISEHDFVTLLNDVAEELQKEGTTMNVLSLITRSRSS